MDLWNEYEGRTIDGAFPLTKLLEPEGRSAFFSTSNGTGVPMLLRLIESHFDDEEILARWRGVEALKHRNLLHIKKFGPVVLDETALVYAVMEPVEGNLGEILSQRRLTVLEAKEVAASLVAALEELHSHGFVHEHVEAGNVFAVGDAIKLRSDCVREAPEGADGSRLKRRDVHDLAAVLLRALTQQRTLEAAARDLPLSAPFDQIVNKGMSGEWGLREIAAALPPVVVPTAAARPAETMTKAAPAARVVAAEPVKRPVAATAAAATGASVASPVSTMGRMRVPVEDEPKKMEWRKIAYGVGAVLILLLGWLVLRGHSTKQSGVAPETTTLATMGQGGQADATAKAAPPMKPSPIVNAADRQAKRPVAQPVGVQWRVVAYTYNHEAQAREKAAAMAQRYGALQPEVFSPNGRAPYLVTVGGVMSRDQAYALARKARSQGLPRDIYAQNYTGKGR